MNDILAYECDTGGDGCISCGSITYDYRDDDRECSDCLITPLNENANSEVDNG